MKYLQEVREQEFRDDCPPTSTDQDLPRENVFISTSFVSLSNYPPSAIPWPLSG
jgi:hypothetical protein